jgi:fluoroquinolone resistance protein
MSSDIHESDDFYDAAFSGAEARKAKFVNKSFEACDFERCSFVDATFQGCKFVDCTFRGCDLSNLKVPDSRFRDVSFEECKAIGISWDSAEWPRHSANARLAFRKSILNDASFFGLKLHALVIEACKVHDVDFRDGDFTESHFVDSDLKMSLFNDTCLRDADFTGAVEYDIDVRHNDVRNARFSRYEAVRLLQGLQIKVVD